MAHPHESHESHEAPTAPAAHDAPPTPTQHHTVEEATLLLLGGLQVMGPRLAHGYACPFQHAGPCTCGYQQVIEGIEELVDALQAPPPEGAKRH